MDNVMGLQSEPLLTTLMNSFTSGNDDIEGTSGNDTLQGGEGNDSIHGKAGNDELYGDAGNDTLKGGDGNDKLYGGSGVNQFQGGKHDDTYYIDSTDAGSTIVELAGEGHDTVIAYKDFSLSSFVEDLTLMGNAVTGLGNGLANLITGNGLNNNLSGGAGDDTLVGGAGVDTMSGGAGNDFFYVDHGSDRIIEAVSEGIDTIVSLISGDITLSSFIPIENLTLSNTLSANINATGNLLSNIITGNNGNNRLSGAAGNDTLFGIGGNDTLDGGLGSDVMYGGSGNDTYIVNIASDQAIEDIAGAAGGTLDEVQTSVTYTLGNNIERLYLTGDSNISGTGNDLNNLMTGNANDNSLRGGLGNDTIRGYGGRDYLDGGIGSDSMHGGQGNDSYVVDNTGDIAAEGGVADDLIGGIDNVYASVSHNLGDGIENLTFTGAANLNGSGNTKNNVLIGNDGRNVLNGREGHDEIFGGAENDLLYGDFGNDTLSGGSGNDTLIGRQGLDELRGGAGSDSFDFYNANMGVDTIVDFTLASDKITVSRYGFGNTLPLGTLGAARFSLNGVGMSASTRFIYHQTTGNLFFDADGSGLGAMVHFATLNPNVALTAAHFTVV